MWIWRLPVPAGAGGLGGQALGVGVRERQEAAHLGRDDAGELEVVEHRRGFVTGVGAGLSGAASRRSNASWR